MSRIGNQPVQIPEGTEVTLQSDLILVKGKHGEVAVPQQVGIDVTINDGAVQVSRKTDKKKMRALHGLTRSLINGAVKGVNEPWEKHLEVTGTGYKVKMQGQDLVFDVGYSHSVTYTHKEDVQFKVAGNKITLSGINKQRVGEVANQIKSIKKPDPYKGKGIRYVGEVLRLKPGKKAKTAA